MSTPKIPAWAVVTCVALLAGCGGGTSGSSSGDPAAATYTVGGAVTGLAGTGLVLSDNGGDSLPVSGNGPFKFPTAVANAGAYDVTVSTQPTGPSQSCNVTNASGPISGSNVTNVAVTCMTTGYKVGGTASGVEGSGLVLQDNGGDDLQVAPGATGFTFATAVASGTSYGVTVLTQPSNPAQSCTVSNGSGAIGAGDVTTIQLTCGTGAVSSSFDLIDSALHAGTINLETAIEYKMFATFKDPRLPLAYQGNDGDVLETDAFDLTWQNWATLSDAAKQTLLPFLVPPIYKGSWVSPQAVGTGGGTRIATSIRPRIKALNIQPCQAPEVDANWAAQLGTHVKVWYDLRAPGAAAQASFARDELENNIWPKIVSGIGMKAPLGDTNIAGCNGGDGLFDVYLVDMATTGQTATDLGETLPDQGFNLKVAPAFIMVNRSLDNDALKGTLAHEFMHASQWAYPVAGFSLSGYKWLQESTAQAAIDVVYPTLPGTCKTPTVQQFEQCKAPYFMSSPELSIDDSSNLSRVYGSYLFFQFLMRTNSPSILGDIWNATTSQSDQLLAVDTTIPGGFQQQWPLFAKLLWNQPPVDVNSFSAWDSLTLTPEPQSLGDASAPTKLSLGGQPTASVPMDGNIPHLAIHYYQFKITDSSIRSVIFLNDVDAISADPSLHVSTQAFFQVQGGIWQYEHWSQGGALDQTKFFCLDVTSERIQDLVIVISNDTPKTDITGETDSIQPRISISNAGCWRYMGTVDAERNLTDASGHHQSSVTGTVTYERLLEPAPLLYGGSGVIFFHVISGALTGTSEDTSTDGSLTETASGSIPADTRSESTLALIAGFDMGPAGIQPRTVSAAPGTSTLLTHIVSVIGSAPPNVYDNPQDWTWLAFPPDSSPSVMLQSDSTITGSYLDTDGTTYTWNLSPQRQP